MLWFASIFVNEQFLAVLRQFFGSSSAFCSPHTKFGDAPRLELAAAPWPWPSLVIAKLSWKYLGSLLIQRGRPSIPAEIKKKVDSLENDSPGLLKRFAKVTMNCQAGHRRSRGLFSGPTRDDG